MSPTRNSVINLVEAAYRPSLPAAAWLEQILLAARAFDQGLGVFAALERLGAFGREELAFGSLDNPALATFLARVRDHANPMANLIASSLVTVGSLRDIVSPHDAAAVEPFFGALAPLGIADLWGIGATEPETGLILAVCWPTARVREPAGFRSWCRAGLHLAAGVRLRGAFLRHGAVDPQAVLTPDGRVVHAEGEVAAHRPLRERLSDGVRASERARGPERDDPERALDLWQALTAGRFSLVDRVESDGRRYVLALPNTPEGESPFGLAPRERDAVRWVVDGASNKAAAYAMGLTVGGFSAQLARAMRKLKVKNRTELKLLAAHSRAVTESSAAASSTARGFVAVPLAGQGGGPIAGLTRHQQALIELVAQGLSNEAISQALGVSPHTVRNRIATLSQKVGGLTRSELARLLVEPKPALPGPAAAKQRY